MCALSKEDAFSLEIGKAVAAWSYIETGLCTYFQRITKMDPATARRVFYSIGGFDGRRRALISIIAQNPAEPDSVAFLNKAVGRAGNYSGSRNNMMHGDVINVGVPTSKYFGQMILLQGSAIILGASDLPKSEVMTLDNIIMARENFATLAGCIHRGLNWDGKDPEESHAKLAGLIDLLPPVAHLTRFRPEYRSKVSTRKIKSASLAVVSGALFTTHPPAPACHAVF